MNIGPMLNAYPDSMGGTLDDIAAFLQKPEMKDVFSSCYVLPSLFHTDLDRGFSVIDYSLNKMLASREALDKLEGLGIDLKLDFTRPKFSHEWPPSVVQRTRQRWLPTAEVTCMPR